MITIHYHRFDGDYERVSLWTWDGRDQQTPEQAEVFPAGTDDFGPYFHVDPSQYGDDDGPGDRIGFIPRLRQDWNEKDGTDRFWTPRLGREIWLIGNNSKLFTERPETSPKVARAYLDGAQEIVAVLSHPMDRDRVTVENFKVEQVIGSPSDAAAGLSSSKNIEITEVVPGGYANGQVEQVIIRTAEELQYPGPTYHVSAKEYRAGAVSPRALLDDPTRYHTAKPMGAIYTPEATTFRLFSPKATEATVILFDEPVGEQGRQEIPMTSVGKGVWEATVEGDLEGRHYRVSAETIYGTEPLEVNDPYATNTVGLDGNARITDLRALDPEGFRPVQHPFTGRPTDAVIWEIHIRDFTIAENSGVDADKRGKYLGFVQPGTTHPDDPSISTGLDHLKELGITHVQILPPQDYDNREDDPDYNWGYMTSFFNSPEGSYSSDFRTASRVHEFKKMVQELHKSDIGVVIDVVYNHTAPTATFEAVCPGYYHRMKADGSMWNGSGTGNEFRSEAPMGRQFIVDSLKFWVEEYGVDGFRFDLMGLIDLETLKQAKAELEEMYPHILFYGEPWAAAGQDGVGIKKITYKNVVTGTGIGAFNDHFRDALKGSTEGRDGGFVQNGSRRDAVKVGIMGGIDDWASDPIQTINYATCHDNLVLWDKLEISSDAAEETRKKMQMLTGGILGVSQGVMFLHAGHEMCRTKFGDHNSYSSGDEINQVDWDLKKKNKDVVDYHTGIIALRRAHPIFRLDSAEEVRSRLTFLEEELPHHNAIVFTLDAEELEGESWNGAAVFINPTTETLTFENPLVEGAMVYVHGTQASAEPLRALDSPVIEVPAHTMAVIATE
ncbi:MAG: type I pullulanase [Sumerlaeia bacterium]